MRSFISFAIAAVAVLAMSVSCTPSSDKITEGQILRQYNKYLKDQVKDKSFATIQVGEFECNSDLIRKNYRKMAAAGLITYEVNRLAWWEKTNKKVSQSYSQPVYYYGYYLGDETKYKTVRKDVYNFEDHYIVTVALTDLGRKYVVDKLPLPVEDVDKDLEEPDVDPSTYAWNQTDISEEWPEIENPFIEKPEPKESSEKKEETTPKKESAPAPEPEVVRIDSLQYVAYCAFDEASTVVYVKAGEMEAFRARDIQIINIAGIARAKSEVILRNKNVTDFGRILYGMEDGDKDIDTPVFEFYLDKGWVLDPDPDIED